MNHKLIYFQVNVLTSHHKMTYIHLLITDSIHPPPPPSAKKKFKYKNSDYRNKGYYDKIMVLIEVDLCLWLIKFIGLISKQDISTTHSRICDLQNHVLYPKLLKK